MTIGLRVYVVGDRGVWFCCTAVPRRYGTAWLCGACRGRRRGVVLRLYDDQHSRVRTRCPICQRSVRVEMVGAPIRMRWLGRDVVHW